MNSHFHAVLGQRRELQINNNLNDAQVIHLAWEFFQRKDEDQVARATFVGHKSLLLEVGRRFRTTASLADQNTLTARFFLAWHLSEMLEWFWEHSARELEKRALSVLIGETLAEGLRCIALCSSRHGESLGTWSGHIGPYMLLLGARMCLRDKLGKSANERAAIFLDKAVTSLGNIPVTRTRMDLYRQLCREYRRVGAWRKSIHWGIEACKVDHVPFTERLKCLSAVMFGWYPT